MQHPINISKKVELGCLEALSVCLVEVGCGYVNCYSLPSIHQYIA
jgi:hypothetical protein